MGVEVLRFGHRYARDKRISTHIGLVSRAFGAEKLVMDIKDPEVIESLTQVNEDWGPSLSIEVIENYKKYIRDFKGDTIHLTMYGININSCEKEVLADNKDKLIIVGGRKVPSEVYSLVDYNIAVGNQPHSEVAALAVFLDRFYSGKELDIEFKGKKRIEPQKKGKKVIEFS